MTEKKEYAPELRLDYDESEDAGFNKFAEISRKKKVADQWVPDPSKPKKKVAKVYNETAIVFMFRDAYNKNGAYPVYNGSEFCVWKAVVGDYNEETGEFTTTGGEVSFIDNSKDRWVTDRIKNLIDKHVGTADVKQHVFVIGKRPGKAPMPSWFVEYLGETVSDVSPTPKAQASSIQLTPVEDEVVDRLNQSLSARNMGLEAYAVEKGKSVEQVIIDLFTTGMAKDEGGKPIKLPMERATLLAKNAKAIGFVL